MKPKNRVQLFDNWAKDYHPGNSSTGEGFPFAGYDRILDEVVN